jgi:hypothetical protein
MMYNGVQNKNRAKRQCDMSVRVRVGDEFMGRFYGGIDARIFPTQITWISQIYADEFTPS